MKAKKKGSTICEKLQSERIQTVQPLLIHIERVLAEVHGSGLHVCLVHGFAYPFQCKENFVLGPNIFMHDAG